MEGGWIKIFYSIQKWKWVDNQTMVYFWVRLLLKANWRDEELDGIEVKRGSILTNRRMLATEFKMTERQVRYCLDKLREGREIVTKNAGKLSIITICKYEDYQGSPLANCPDDCPPFVQDKTSSPAHRNSNIYNLTTQKLKEDEEDINPPFYARESWRYPSSVTKASLGFNPDAIADKRKELMGAELSAIASEIGMPKEAQERFLAKWCEHNPGSDKIKADYEPTFNVRDRATQFMGWWKQKDQPKTEKQPLGEYYKDLIDRMGKKYGLGQTNSGVPDEQ